MIFLKGKSECYVMFSYRLLILCVYLWEQKPQRNVLKGKRVTFSMEAF